MKNSTIALVATGVIATAGIGYLVYFDSKRRSDPDFRKQLSKKGKEISTHNQVINLLFLT